MENVNFNSILDREKIAEVIKQSLRDFESNKSDLLKKPYKNFLKYILPFTGSIVAHDRHSYKYLAESIISFPSQISLVNELKNIGFSHVKTIDFISGANSIYILQKK